MLDNLKKKVSVTSKLIVIFILLIAFLPGTVIVQSLIQERQHLQEETLTEISGKWGGAQQIVGPVLQVPYKNLYGQTKDAYFFPDTLDITGDLTSEVRSRGIYDVSLFRGGLNLSGKFNANAWDLGVNPDALDWENATISLAISDQKGITENATLAFNGKSSQMKPSTNIKSLTRGLHLPVSANPNGQDNYYSIDLNLQGSGTLSFLPVAATTSVNIASDWPSPSFSGDFLPVERQITDEGFTANWSVLEINRDIKSAWNSDGIQSSDLTYNSNYFGVEFFQPVDVYQKSTRSAKYGLAVIALVFGSFFITEILYRRRLHPVQYIMVGLALVIFYTLLISIAEFIRFGYAYLIASLAVISLITLYSQSALGSKKLALTNGGLLTVLYLFIYVLLQMQEATLLVGSIGIFFILAAAMYSTRKVNWYSEEK